MTIDREWLHVLVEILTVVGGVVIVWVKMEVTQAVQRTELKGLRRDIERILKHFNLSTGEGD